MSDNGKVRERVPRITLNVEEAAKALGMSRDHFERHVYHDLRLIRSGRKVLVPIRELERWVDLNAALVLS